MTTEDYVSFETAKLLKEKGFDEKCRYVYDKNGNMISSECFMEGESFIDNNGIELTAKYDGWNTDTQGIYAFLCPTLQMAMKWFREIHNIYIEVDLSFSEDPIKYPPVYYVFILDSKSGNSVIDRAARIDGLNPLVDVDNVPRDFNTYEEACEVGIKYCLENLI